MCQPNTDDTDPDINLSEQNLDFDLNLQEDVEHLWQDEGGEG